MKWRKKQDPITRKISNMFLGITFAIAGTLIGLSLILGISIKDGWDVANWATLVVEIGIGIAIASAILIYEGGKREKSQEQQDKITELIEETKKITSELERKNIENEKYHTEQKEFAIHRARSYLGALHNIIAVLATSNLDPNIPPEHNAYFNSNYEQKNEIVRQLEFIVNQSDSVLEQSFLQKITDVIELARITPNVTNEDFGFGLDISRCMGLRSQIDKLLKMMPNPPV